MEKIKFHESIQAEVDEVESRYVCPVCGGQLVLFDVWWLLYCLTCPKGWAITEQGLVDYETLRG
jgi:hypothetical protein